MNKEELTAARENKPALSFVKDRCDVDGIDTIHLSGYQLAALLEEYKAQQPTTGKSEAGFLVREFNSDKYYWCKCENCGWEDSSQYCEGGGAMADTGDFCDPMCPICFSNKIEGKSALDVPDSYDGIYKIKIPVGLIIEPYKKTLESLRKEIDDLRFPELPASQPTTTGEGEYQISQNEYHLRLSWEQTCIERDELKEQVKALEVVKNAAIKALQSELTRLKAAPTEGEQLYRWIKASERLPIERKVYFVRTIHRNDRPDPDNYVPDCWLMENGKRVFVYEEYEDWYILAEWLEPIPTEPQTNTKK